MENKKLKLVIAYDIQDMEGNSQVPEDFGNTCEVLLPDHNLNKVNFGTIASSIWTVIQYLQQQVYQDTGFEVESLPLFSKETSRKVSLHVPVKQVRMRRYLSRIQEMENSQNECPLTQCQFEYYGIDVSHLPEKLQNSDSYRNWFQSILK